MEDKKEYFDLNKRTDIINITEQCRKGSVIYFKGKDGKEYSHFVNFKNCGWETNLKVGNNVRMFIIEREIGGKVVNNVYPDRFSKQVLFSDEEIN